MKVNTVADNFKPGDACIIVDSHHHPEGVGRECEFIRYLTEPETADGFVSDCVIDIPGFISFMHPKGYWLANSKHLRKRKPKEGLDTLENISGYRPAEKVKP